MRVVLHRGLILVAVGLLAACTSGGPAAGGPTSTSRPGNATTPTTTTTLPTVLTNVTPAGWVPVDFGEAQISVPAGWRIGYDAACPLPLAPGAIYVGLENGLCPAVASQSRKAFPVVTIMALTWSKYGPSTPRTINGLRVSWASSDGTLTFWVPELHVVIHAWGPGAADVISTLTRSPAAVALVAGPAPAVPRTWKWVTGGDVRFAVPGRWPARKGNQDGPICGWPRYALPTRDQVVVDSDSFTGPVFCPLALPQRIPPQPENGVVVDLHPSARVDWPPSTTLGRCLHLHGLTACLYDRTPTATDDQMAELDILFVQVTMPGHSGHEVLEIGLAGDGMVARTILYSLRPA